MPLEYVRDDATRRIRITVTDPVQVRDFIASVERQLADGAWQYGVLVDARRLSDTPPPTEIKVFVSRVHELFIAHGPRGPVAFVARKSEVIGSAQIYSFLGGKTESIEVFWNLDDGQEWLDDRMAHERQTL